jgi:hypothetical protein
MKIQMNRLLYTVVMLLFTLAINSLGIAQEVRDFKAGAAVIEITPKEPVPMWGYGSRHGSLSQGTLDPLKATALVMQVGNRKLAVVGLDLGRSPSEALLVRIRETIKQKAGIEYSMIAGSHTHHGPVLELTDKPDHGQGKYDAAIRYYAELEKAIVQVILSANEQLVTVKIGTGTAQLDGFNRNRHSKIEPIPLDRSLSLLNR